MVFLFWLGFLRWQSWLYINYQPIWEGGCWKPSLDWGMTIGNWLWELSIWRVWQIPQCGLLRYFFDRKYWMNDPIIIIIAICPYSLLSILVYICRWMWYFPSWAETQILRYWWAISTLIHDGRRTKRSHLIIRICGRNCILKNREIRVMGIGTCPTNEYRSTIIMNLFPLFILTYHLIGLIVFLYDRTNALLNPSKSLEPKRSNTFPNLFTLRIIAVYMQ